LQPMHMMLHEMMRLNPRSFDLLLLKMTLKRNLLALNFLHTETGLFILVYTTILIMARYEVLTELDL
jgi:hypothetical protein